MNTEQAKKILEHFCSFPLHTAEGVLKEFAALPGAVAHFDGDKFNFVYVPGTREDRVLLVAHADTVWDSFYYSCDNSNLYKQKPVEQDGVYMGESILCGIGADDRAGCAILYCLKDLGHSLLITDGEECGQIASHYIENRYPELFDEINRHAYILQFDRRGTDNYKVYNLPVSEAFLQFVERSTGFYNAGTTSRTDIVALCRDVCGVNLSIGYYNEHSANECLVFAEWLKTLNIAEKLLAEKQTRYPLKIISGN